MKKPLWVADLLESLTKGHKLMDPSAWAPPNPFLLDPLFEDLWLAKIKQVKDAALEKNISFRQMADSIIGPSCIRKEFRYALWGLKLRQMPIDFVFEIMTFYKNILETRANPDPFALNQAYWHTPQQIQEIVTKSKWTRATPKSQKVIGQISGNCPALAWSLHTDFFYHRAYEVFGLYKNLNKFDQRFKPSDRLMIRQFGPFRAGAIWPDSEKFPINKITIFGIYKNLHCDFDYINHFTTTENIPEKLQYYNIVVDGIVVNDPVKLRLVNKKIVTMAIKQDEQLRSLDSEEQKRLTVLSKYYALKELCDLVKLPWYPEKEVLNRFSNRPLLKIKFSRLSEKKREQFWKNLFNPFIKLSNPEFIKAVKQLNHYE